ncbi:hypothetical protein MTO96_048114 [Rhipicephalus appendiculatus]
MNERGRPEQECRPGADQPDVLELSPADCVSPERLSSARTSSTDSFAPRKRSRRRSSSKDKSAKNEDDPKKGFRSSDPAARNVSVTGQSGTDLPPTRLPPTEVAVASCQNAASEPPAKNLSEEPAERLSPEISYVRDSAAVGQDLISKETSSKDVSANDKPTKDLTAKESSSKHGSANELPERKNSAIGGLNKYALSEDTPPRRLPYDLSTKELPATEGSANDLSGTGNTDERDIGKGLYNK